MAALSGLRDGIRWLFLDLGSTLVDEERVYHHRMEDIARMAGLSFQEVFDREMAFYRSNRRGEVELLRELGVPKPAWYFEEEQLYPDAAEALAALHRDYKIGIIANQKPGTAERLKQMGVACHIDQVTASAEEGVAKPDYRIFQIALDRAGCRPAEAVMIGDRLDNDIAPAKAMGMHTVWLRQGYSALWTPDRPEYIPDETATSLTELTRLLARG